MKKNKQIYKIFPNDFEKNNYIKTKNLSIPLKNIDTEKTKYNLQIKFPKNINEDRIDEYLMFFFSKEDIHFFHDYPTREELIKKFMREKSVKLMYKGYTISRK